VHRIGRTARASSEGTAYTFVSEKEQQKFAAIETLLRKISDPKHKCLNNLEKPQPTIQDLPELAVEVEDKGVLRVHLEAVIDIKKLEVGIKIWISSM
jgi:superfamily II DNA/RNA helicase